MGDSGSQAISLFFAAGAIILARAEPIAISPLFVPTPLYAVHC